jgi:hypothetical protein
MFPLLRRHWTLWSAWILTSTVLLFASPLGHFGWAELFACLGSFVLSIDPRIRREAVLATGLPLIVLLGSLDAEGASVLRFILDWVVFTGSVMLGMRAVDDQRELELIAGHLALGGPVARGLDAFLAAVEDEIARARRHGRSFVLLSIAPHPRSLETEPLGEGRVLRQLARARGVYELVNVVEAEMHRYSSFVVTGERVLCLVPEMDEEESGTLIVRLAGASQREYGIEIEAGIAEFPGRGLSVHDLITAADESRATPRLEPVSKETEEEEGALVEDWDSEEGPPLHHVQG